VKHIKIKPQLIIKFSASSCLILRNKYIEIHGQQYIYKDNFFRVTKRLTFQKTGIFSA